MDKGLHRQEQQWLVRGLALGGLCPSRAGGAGEGGEEFEGGGKVGHGYSGYLNLLKVATPLIWTNLYRHYFNQCLGICCSYY